MQAGFWASDETLQPATLGESSKTLHATVERSWPKHITFTPRASRLAQPFGEEDEVPSLTFTKPFPKVLDIFLKQMPLKVIEARPQERNAPASIINFVVSE